VSLASYPSSYLKSVCTYLHRNSSLRFLRAVITLYNPSHDIDLSQRFGFDIVAMRLLRVDEQGDLSSTEFIGDSIPSYAILSHTWGPSQDEVTWRDLYEGRAK
jgi:hypothetical protein